MANRREPHTGGEGADRSQEIVYRRMLAAANKRAANPNPAERAARGKHGTRLVWGYPLGRNAADVSMNNPPASGSNPGITVQNTHRHLDQGRKVRALAAWKLRNITS